MVSRLVYEGVDVPHQGDPRLPLAAQLALLDREVTVDHDHRDPPLAHRVAHAQPDLPPALKRDSPECDVGLAIVQQLVDDTKNVSSDRSK